MITRLDLALCRTKKCPQSVLTTEEALQRAMQFGTIITVSVYSTDTNDQKWFFTDNHLFGYGVIHKNFVPCTSGFPMNVIPREGLESGVISTIEDYIKIFHAEGTQLTTVEEVVQLSNQMTKEEQTYKKLKNKGTLKFDPAFFPQGTVFQIDTLREGKDVFTVHGVFRNGANSYVLETEETYIRGGSVERHAFNVNMVQRIIKRGSGPMVIDHDATDLTVVLQKSLGFHGKKTYYSDHAHYVLKSLIQRHCTAGNACVDMDSMKTAFIGAVSKKVQGSIGYGLIFNKKKAKKWVKQNYNRFLFSPVLAQQQEDQEMRDLWKSMV